MEKKIMKPAEIWTTLRLPILVAPSIPTFSLHRYKPSLSRKPFESKKEIIFIMKMISVRTLKLWTQFLFRRAHPAERLLPDGINSQ